MKGLRATTTAMFAGIAAALAMTGLVATPAALASPHAPVSPRVQCGGFNGHVAWNEPWPWEGFHVHVWGIVWTTCHRSDTALQLSYDAPGPVTKLAGQTNRKYGLYANGVDYQANWGFSNPGHISVKVCNNYGGHWHCGKSRFV